MKKIEIENGLYITSDRCVWYEPEKTVMIADLHLGYESALKENGFSFPLSQKEKILDKISSIKNRYSPENIVVLGDFKHNFGKMEDDEFHELLDVIDYLMEDASLVMLRGNHDNYLKNLTELKGVTLYQDKMELHDMILTHGDEMVESDGTLIMGHEHPSIKIVDEVGSSMRFPSYLYHETEKILVLPAFSTFAEGRDVVASDFFFSDILESFNIEMERFHVYAISDEGLIDFRTIEEVRKAYSCY